MDTNEEFTKDLKDLGELDLLTIEQAAWILKVSPKTISRYTKQEVNPLPIIKLSVQEHRISKVDLLEWAQSLKDPRQDV